MDAIAQMLSSHRAEGAFVIRSDLRPPWAIRVEDRAPLTVVVVVQGSAELSVVGRTPERLGRGDAALVTAEAAGYTLADDLSTPPQARIGPGQTCTKPDGSPLSDFRRLGVLAWGNVADGPAETVLLTSTYEGERQLGRQLLDHLPTTFVVRAEDAPARLAAVVDLLLGETESEGAAEEVVLDRLVDLVCIGLLRHWFEEPTHRPRWYAAYDHPVVGPALRRLHHEPHRPWTLASLAADIGVSRATLARRFAEEVGETPMTYLAHWRLDLAADLLVSTDQKLERIASDVGYASGFSLSGAFHRRHGISPSAFRRQPLRRTVAKPLPDEASTSRR